MDETKYVTLKLPFDFALEVWFSIYIYFDCETLSSDKKMCIEDVICEPLECS